MLISTETMAYNWSQNSVTSFDLVTSLEGLSNDGSHISTQDQAFHHHITNFVENQIHAISNFNEVNQDYSTQDLAFSVLNFVEGSQIIPSHEPIEMMETVLEQRHMESVNQERFVS